MLTEMRKKIGEQGDVWQYLSSLNRPIVMYGMGNGADKILKVCGQRGDVYKRQVHRQAKLQPCSR